MDVILQLVSEDLSADVTHGLLRDLCRDLNRETGAHATLVDGPAQPGARGDVLSQFITMASSEAYSHAAGVMAAEVVLGVLKMYFERNSRLRMKIRGRHGKEVTVGPESISPERAPYTANDLAAVLGG